MKNVLILCTGNSARSILGEAILNRVGQGQFRAFSAGSHPKGAPNPLAIELLQELGYPTNGLRSKSWDEFTNAGAPKIDLVITVCSAAAGEACPHFPGTPMRLNIPVYDPSDAPGGIADQRAAFRQAYDRLTAKITALVALLAACPVPEDFGPEDFHKQFAAITALDSGLER